MPDRHSVGDLIVIAVMVVVALFFGTTKLINTWPGATSTARVAGNLMTSVCCALMCGWLLNDFAAESPELLFAVAGAAAWIGGDILDRLARLILRNLNGSLEK